MTLTRRYQQIGAKLTVIALATAALFPASASGQTPYELSWKRDGPVGVGALAFGLGSWIVQDRVTPLTPEEIAACLRSEVNPLDRGATHLYSEDAADASDWLLYSILAAPLGMLADPQVWDDWPTFLLMYAEALALNGGAGQFIKGLTLRTRPYVYNPDIPMELKTHVEARQSFYSSHTAFAFSSALFLTTTLADYLGNSQYVAPLAGFTLLGAAVVGVLRYTSGNHFPTDILVGALVGSLIGWSIPALHRTSAEPASPTIGFGVSIPL